MSGPVLGECVKHLFSIDPENRSINFGSYGCPPKAMTEKRLEYVYAIDADTDTFMRIGGEVALRRVREAMSSFIGWDKDPDDIMLVDNAAYAYNVIAESLLHNPWVHRVLLHSKSKKHNPNSTGGEEEKKHPLKMLVLDRIYPMCSAANKFWNDRSALVGGDGGSFIGHLDIDVFTVTAEMCEADPAVLEDAIVQRVCEGMYDFFVVDHIGWSPALVYPIINICRRIREHYRTLLGQPRELVIIVDGAHAVGNVDLVPIFNAQSKEHLFDAFFSNYHKWLASPRHAAFLWVDPRWQCFVHPCVKSNFFRSERFPSSSEAASTITVKDLAEHPQRYNNKSAMQKEFFWCGTRDLTNFLVLPDVVAFRRTVLGGEAHIREYTHTLAFEGAQRVAAVWNSTLVVPQRERLCTLSNVYCPAGCTTAEANAIVDRMLRTKKCYGAILEIGGRPFLRISAQVYNSLDDYVHFAHLFLEMLQEDRNAAGTTNR